MNRDQASNIISPDYRPSVSKTFVENPGPGTYYQDPIEQMKKNKRGRGVRFGGGPRFEQFYFFFNIFPLGSEHSHIFLLIKKIS